MQIAQGFFLSVFMDKVAVSLPCHHPNKPWYDCPLKLIQTSRNVLFPSGNSFTDMDVLPQSIMLLIFSYLPYEFVQTIASLVCKAWHQLAYDKNFIKYAGRKDLSEINARDSLKETVDNFLQAVKWRPRMFHSIDLCGATTTWKTFGEIAHNCTELKILNMARRAKFLNTHWFKQPTLWN